MVDAVRRARRLRPVPPVPPVQRPALRQEPPAVQDRSRARYGEARGRHRLLRPVSADGLMAGAGYYAMAKDQLERFRAAVDDDAHRRARSPAIVAAARRSGYRIGAIDELKTAPRGYPKDHPRIDLLRRKGLMTSRDFGRRRRGCTPSRRSTKVREAWRAAAPLCAWLDAHVGPSTLPPDGRVRLTPVDAADRLSIVTVTDPHRDALENQFGLADRVVDDDALANSVERFRERGITLPTFAELADPSTIDHGRVGDADPQGARRPQPVAGPLVQRPRRRPGRRARARRAAVVADRRREPDHRRVRRPLPDDHRPQGARRLRLPRAAHRHRAVRPDPPPGDLAVDGQLRPRRHRHQPDHGQPRRGDPARGDEPGALRLARPVVREPGRRRDPHARHGVQRQGDLRRLQRAGRAIPTTSCSTSSASSATTSATTRSPGGRSEHVFDARRAAASRRCGWRRSCRPPGRPARSPPATG